MKDKIAIIGESCVDEYVFGTCDRVCPEASALCFTHKNNRTTNFGMAANVLANIKAIDKTNIIEYDFISPQSKIIKRRFIDSKYNTILFREDINDHADRIDVDQYDLSKYSHIIISDYNKGFLIEDDIQTIRERSREDCIIFIDTKKKIKNISQSVDFIKINHSEFLSNIEDINEVISYCSLIVTEGENGATLYDKGKTVKFSTEKVSLRDVCGAGDTFLAALVYNFYITKDIHQSIKFANSCSSIVVSKFGVCTI